MILSQSMIVNTSSNDNTANKNGGAGGVGGIGGYGGCIKLTPSSTTPTSSHIKIAQSYTQNLCRMIQKGTMSKRCVIQNCFINDSHAAQIAKAIGQASKPIQTFSLYKCPNLSPNVGVTTILSSLANANANHANHHNHCHSLTRLELSKVILDDVALQELTRILPTFTKLQTLVLVETQDDMAEDPTCIETWQDLFHAVLFHPTIQSFDLTRNDLDEDHMQALGEEFQQLLISKSSKSRTSSSTQDQEEQTDSPSSSSSTVVVAGNLDSLILSRNPIGNDGLEALCNGFRQTSSSSSSSSSSPTNNNVVASLPLTLLALGECNLTDLTPLLNLSTTFVPGASSSSSSCCLNNLERLYLYSNPLLDNDDEEEDDDDDDEIENENNYHHSSSTTTALSQMDQINEWINANITRKEQEQQMLLLQD